MLLSQDKEPRNELLFMKASRGFCVWTNGCMAPCTAPGGVCADHWIVARVKSQKKVEKASKSGNSKTRKSEFWTKDELGDSGVDITKLSNETKALLAKSSLPPFYRPMVNALASNAVSFDLEFVSTRAGCLLHSFAVVEVATRKVLLHCRIDYERPASDLAAEWIADVAHNWTKSKIYNSIMKWHTSATKHVETLKPKEFHDRLVKLKLTDSIWIQWHASIEKGDYGIVKRFFQQYNLDPTAALPPLARVFSPLRLYAFDLRATTRIAAQDWMTKWKLERVYLLLCRDGDLSYQHHDAATDALKQIDVLAAIVKTIKK